MVVRTDDKQLILRWKGSGSFFLKKGQTHIRSFSLSWLWPYDARPPKESEVVSSIRINGQVVGMVDMTEKTSISSPFGYFLGVTEFSLRTVIEYTDEVEVKVMSFRKRNGIERAIKIINGGLNA